MPATRTGVVIFTGDKERLARFYGALTGLPVETSDDAVTVLASDEFELVIHLLPGEPAGPVHAPGAAREAYVKPFFAVPSLAKARAVAAELGGQMGPAPEEWTARGFRACEGADPDGNPVQLRESVH